MRAAAVRTGGALARRVALTLGLMGVAVSPAVAQQGAQQEPRQEGRAQTLADIRAELDTLRAALDDLRAELAPGGAPSAAAPLPDSVLDRVAALERAVQRLTGATEALGFRIEAVVADGTNRIGDLAFRLTELEGGDPAALAPPAPLGGDAGPRGADDGPQAPGSAPAQSGDADAIAPLPGEQAAFDAAAAAHADGDWSAAEAALADFTQAYPLGPLTARAHLLRADALERLGDAALAARAWLAGYDADPDGAEAPAALLGLGRALAGLDQTEEACVLLDEVTVRFPDAPQAAEAAGARAGLGCP